MKLKMKRAVIISLLCLFCVINVSFASTGEATAINSGIVNKKVDRNIDISSQLVKVTTKITLENTAKSPVTNFVFTLDDEIKDKLAFFTAHALDDGKVTLDIAETQVLKHSDKATYKIKLRKPLDAGKETVIEVETVFTNALIPYPSEILQSEKQLILYHGNHYYYSPYQTKTQTTSVQLSSNNVESYTKLKPVSQSESTVTYGPYENIAPFSVNKLTVHYENSSPFLVITNLKRLIEVSHWGVISIEEEYDIKHNGAVLKGAFSRYEYQRDMSGLSSIKSFKTILPASAGDVYYRDEIGNISTSHLRILEDSVEVDLRPRFPLFGGWKTHYILGYYVPTYEYLFHSGNNYALKMRFVDHVFDDSIIEDAVVKVILPEGSKDIKLKFPYDIERRGNEVHHTYLDTIGRPVVVLHKKNLVEQHIQDFELHYKYEKMLMLQEPILVVVAFFLLFLLVIVYVRLDFTITHDPHKESKLKVVGLIEHIQSHQQTRADLYTQFDSALQKYKSSRDANAYKATLKKLNGDYQSATQSIADLLTKLKQEGSEVAEKVKELQNLDKNLKELLTKHSSTVDDFFADKINKQKLVSSETAITKKKEEIAEKIVHLTSTF